MDHHIKDYFRQSSEGSPGESFHSIIPLHEAPDISWKAIHEKMPNLCRGWYELSHLSPKDKIEFTRDFWLSKLPYRAGMGEFLGKFFDSLDDIGIFLSQKKFDDPFEATLVYSLKDDKGFFRGSPPISEKNMMALRKFFADYILPEDYLAFLEIHDGFCKTTDCTGIIPSNNMPTSYERLQALVQQHEPIILKSSTMVDPKTLIPFYESFGMPFFQCFWAEWYPEQEMGNVYYSGEAKTISDVSSVAASSEIMAFPTFNDWLMFYMERMIE